MSIKSLLAALVVSLSLVAPVLAGPHEDAEAAYDRKDYATALRLFHPLAEQGDAHAQYNLGMMYAAARSVPRDDKEAVKWFRLSAEQGIAEAQYDLGRSYANGQGVAQDFVQAHKWLLLSAHHSKAKECKKAAFCTSANFWTAVLTGEKLAKHMTTAQKAEAQRLAREWKPKK